MKSPEESQRISNQTFLPEGMDKKLEALVRTSRQLTTPSATATGRKRKNEAAPATAPATPAPRSKKVKAEPGTARTKKTPKKRATRKESTPIDPESVRRSGRHANKVKSYTVDSPSEDSEGFEEEGSDEEMADVSSEEQSESEPEVRSRRTSGRARNGTGGGRKKTSPKATEPTPAAEEESMDVDEPAEKESSAPVAPMATMAVGKRPTRGASAKGKTPEKKQAAKTSSPVVSPRRSSRSKPKEQEQKADGNSSELSDVPDE
jgi:hypothetical protein